MCPFVSSAHKQTKFLAVGDSCAQKERNWFSGVQCVPEWSVFHQCTPVSGHLAVACSSVAGPPSAWPGSSVSGHHPHPAPSPTADYIQYTIQFKLQKLNCTMHRSPCRQSNCNLTDDGLVSLNIYTQIADCTKSSLSLYIIQACSFCGMLANVTHPL